MKYVAPEKLKSEKTAYHGIETMLPWVAKEGTLDRIIETHFPDSKYESMLDLGCGNGDLLLRLKNKFQNLYGADIVSYLNKSATEKIDFKIIDLNTEELPYGDRQFNLVTAFQVIEHLENPFLVMREIKRVLKPDGLFLFSVPNPYNLSFKIKFLFSDNMPPWTRENNHLLFFTKAVLEKTYGAEFELLKSIYQNGSVPFWGRLRKIFGRGVQKHLTILPRSKHFARRVCYVLRKRGQ